MGPQFLRPPQFLTAGPLAETLAFVVVVNSPLPPFNFVTGRGEGGKSTTSVCPRVSISGFCAHDLSCTVQLL